LKAPRVDSLLQEDILDTSLLLGPSSGPGVAAIDGSVMNSGGFPWYTGEDRAMWEEIEDDGGLLGFLMVAGVFVTPHLF
jgi:hypothetical protein